MDRLHVKYLLIGGGIAASEAARAIRERDATGSLVMVTRESSRPYRRPDLSQRYLRREVQRSTIAVEGVAAVPDVTLRTGRSARILDVARHRVSLDDGSELDYDRLLLAVGGQARHLAVPGSEFPNVHYLRTVDDADRLLHAVDAAKLEGLPQPAAGRRGRVVVVGSGLLGVEVAASLAGLGLHVEVVTGRPHPWHHYAGDVVGRLVARTLEAGGVPVHNDAPVARFEGDGRVQRVALADGRRIDANLVVAAVGVEANRELLRNTPVAAERAILVDEQCRTSAPDVFAAGDCCAAFDPLFAKHRYFPHWRFAAMLGATAGDVMAGGEARVDGVVPVQSEWLGHVGRIWGERRVVDRRVVRTLSADRVVEFGVATDGRVAQVVSVGDVGDPEPLRRLVATRAQVGGREEQLRDPAFDLGGLS